jgi:hypothetical protein
LLETIGKSQLEKIQKASAVSPEHIVCRVLCFGEYYPHDEEGIQRKPMEAIVHNFQQYAILNWGVLHLKMNIGEVRQLSEDKSNMSPNQGQRK